MALTPKKKILIEAMIANPSATHIELAEICEVNRNTITAWKRDAEFDAAYRERLREVWAEGEGIAIKAMLDLASKGHYQAAQYILDNRGYKPATKIDANVSNDIVINIDE